MGRAAVPAPRAPAPPEFAEFFRGYYRTLIGVAMAHGATWHEAEDATTQTMEELLLRWGEVRRPERYAARAVVSNFIKKKARDQEAVPRAIKGGYLPREGEPDSRLTDWEDTQWIEHLIERLPDVQRAVARLILVEGAGTAEAAAVLGKNEAAVRKNLQLARSRLKELLQRDRRPELDGLRGPDGRKLDDQ